QVVTHRAYNGLPSESRRTAEGFGRWSGQRWSCGDLPNRDVAGRAPETASITGVKCADPNAVVAGRKRRGGREGRGRQVLLANDLVLPGGEIADPQIITRRSRNGLPSECGSRV